MAGGRQGIQTHVDTNHIACSFPIPQEVNTDAAPTRSTKAMDFFLRRKLVIFHFLPSTHPLDVFALGKDHQVPIALTNTAIAVLDGDMPAFLFGEIRVGKTEAYGTLEVVVNVR